MFIMYIYIAQIQVILIALELGARIPLFEKVTVSSSFGYLIIGSVVAPHDKIDVSRQLTQNS